MLTKSSARFGIALLAVVIHLNLNLNLRAAELIDLLARPGDVGTNQIQAVPNGGTLDIAVPLGTASVTPVSSLQILVVVNNDDVGRTDPDGVATIVQGIFTNLATAKFKLTVPNITPAISVASVKATPAQTADQTIAGRTKVLLEFSFAPGAVIPAVSEGASRRVRLAFSVATGFDVSLAYSAQGAVWSTQQGVPAGFFVYNLNAAPADPLTIASIEDTSITGMFLKRLTITGGAAGNYLVEATESLSTPNWLPQTDTFAHDGMASVITVTHSGFTAQFFRVKSQ